MFLNLSERKFKWKHISFLHEVFNSMCISQLCYNRAKHQAKQAAKARFPLLFFFFYQLGLQSMKAVSACRASLAISQSDFGMCVKCFSSDGKLLTENDEKAVHCCRHHCCETAYIMSV